MTAYAGNVDVDWGQAESSTSAHRSGTQTRAKADPTRPQADPQPVTSASARPKSRRRGFGLRHDVGLKANRPNGDLFVRVGERVGWRCLSRAGTGSVIRPVAPETVC